MSKILVFYRSCDVNANGKVRPNWFSKEGCFKTLMETKDDQCEIHVLFDETNTTKTMKDLEAQFPDVDSITFITGGSDGKSLEASIQYILAKHERNEIHDNDIMYLLEDDYMHKEGWPSIIREGCNVVGASFITLYDHSDKYDVRMYPSLDSKIFVTKSCHWRTTPSTTNTYALRFKVFKATLEEHKEFVKNRTGSQLDHEKFMFLASKGYNVISSIPGYSTHCELQFLSPLWRKTSVQLQQLDSGVQFKQVKEKRDERLL